LAQVITDKLLVDFSNYDFKAEHAEEKC